MDNFLINEANDMAGEKLTCIGIGRFGCNIIYQIQKKEQIHMKLIAIHTDMERPEKIDIVEQIRILPSYRSGNAGLIDTEEIKITLDGADIVFLVVSFKSQSEINVCRILSMLEKEVGALVIPIISMPLLFVNTRMVKNAEYGLEKIKEESDSVIIITSENHEIVDDIFTQAIFGIYGVLVSSGDCDINLDFADVQAIMRHKGMARVRIGEYEGKNAAYQAISNALKPRPLNNVSIDKAQGILVHFSTHPNYPIMEVSEAMDIINESAHDHAEVIFGTSTDKNIAENNIKVTIVLTGLERKYSNLLVVNNTDDEGNSN